MSFVQFKAETHFQVGSVNYRKYKIYYGLQDKIYRKFQYSFCDFVHGLWYFFQAFGMAELITRKK